MRLKIFIILTISVNCMITTAAKQTDKNEKNYFKKIFGPHNHKVKGLAQKRKNRIFLERMKQKKQDQYRNEKKVYSGNLQQVTHFIDHKHSKPLFPTCNELETHGERYFTDKWKTKGSHITFKKPLNVVRKKTLMYAPTLKEKKQLLNILFRSMQLDNKKIAGIGNALEQYPKFTVNGFYKTLRNIDIQSMKELPASVAHYPKKIETLTKYKNSHFAAKLVVDFASKLLAESNKSTNDKKI